MTVDFAEFDIAELRVLSVGDAMGLPEMGASVEIDDNPAYVAQTDDMLGDTGPGVVAAGSCSCCCCCC